MTSMWKREIRPTQHLFAIFAASVLLGALAFAFYHEAPHHDAADYQVLAEISFVESVTVTGRVGCRHPAPADTRSSWQRSTGRGGQLVHRGVCPGRSGGRERAPGDRTILARDRAA